MRQDPVPFKLAVVIGIASWVVFAAMFGPACKKAYNKITCNDVQKILCR